MTYRIKISTFDRNALKMLFKVRNYIIKKNNLICVQRFLPKSNIFYTERNKKLIIEFQVIIAHLKKPFKIHFQQQSV